LLSPLLLIQHSTFFAPVTLQICNVKVG
jgi:hypothetical protein